MYLKIIFELIGGLGIFLYGMDLMSTSMRKIAGPRLKKILASLTNNRLMGVLIGVIVTAIIQSSSASTVMTIGFVNASLLTLKQALGIILGANIGTTITGWILVLKIGAYALPIIGTGAILLMFNKSEKNKTKLIALIGFGFIFLGLNLMGDALKPLKNMPFFVEFFKSFRVDSYFGLWKAALGGALLTALIQSSSATVGITITLATQGFIDYPTAVALVLGENVGTTITACLAVIGANANAKRAAYAHTLINFIGVIWVTTIFKFYLDFLYGFTDVENHIGSAIAAAHTIFNISNVVMLMPFVGYLDKILHKVVKDDDRINERVTHLNPLMMKIPSVLIDQTKKEIRFMSVALKDVFFRLEECLYENKRIQNYYEEIGNTEEKLDKYEKEIYDINFSLLNNRSLTSNLVEETRANLLVCDEYETIGDYLGRISKRINKLYEDSIEIDENRKEILYKLHAMAVKFFDDVNKGFEDGDKKIFAENIKTYAKIKAFHKNARAEHFSNAMEIKSELNTGYLDMINFYRRVVDHTYNIVEHFMKL